jgi:hypothetical protein
MKDIYKKEYETGNLTLPQIQEKYQLSEADTAGWKKKQPLVQPSKSLPVEKSSNTLEEDILELKKEAVKYIKEQLSESHLLDIKEFKDLVSSIKALEDGNKTQQGPTVNILVQNLTERFRDDI